MTAGLAPEQWGVLQETLATESPVLVLGPGCHRIGYEETAGWAEVTRRMNLVHHRIADAFSPEHVPAARSFLERFWLSKLSDEARSGRAHREHLDALRAPAREPDGDGDSLDTCRTALVTQLLGVFLEGTRCLGSEIATGAFPVVAWQDIGHVYPRTEPQATVPQSVDEATSPAFDAHEADVRHRQAGEHLAATLEIASVISAVAGSQPLDDELEAIAHDRLAGVPDLRAKAIARLNDDLKIDTVVFNLKRLQEDAFSGSDGRLTGSTIEWLGDLLWHLVTTDSRVPPSQAETAFYINLQRSDPGAGRSFARSRPSEARRPLSRDAIPGHVRQLLGTYDNGERAWSDIAPSRKAFTRTICAALLAQWEDPSRPPQRPTLALIPDFDLSFERAMLELMEPDQHLHVVVPVWRKPERDPQYIDWFVGTMTRADQDYSHGRHRLPPIERWAKFDEGPKVGKGKGALDGPIFVKPNGSPLLESPRREDLKDIRLLRGEKVQLATIASEYDALQAMISFANGANAKESTAGDVINALQWQHRSCLFLGDSFPDWLPRVRLMVNAPIEFKQLTATPSTRQIAIDRRFDWPEQALLSDMHVEQYECDLAALGAYHTASSGGKPGELVVKHLNAVKAILDAGS
jgi:hypothetical protein